MSRAEGNPKPQYAGVSSDKKTAAYSKTYYDKNKEQRQADGKVQSKRYRDENPEKVSAAKRSKWLSIPQEERSRICNERRLKQRFKRTPEWYENTLEEQGGHCALCTTAPEGRRLQVDHDHGCCPCEGTRYTCGKCVRGLLCIDCNARLGYLEQVLYESFMYPEPCDNTWLEKALKYLSKYRLRHQ
jgi:hypothetical protein